MKYFIETYGCQMNVHDAERMAGLLEQSGYKIVETRGIPAPFPKALGLNFLSRFLIRVNQLLIRISRGLFAYQIFVRAVAKPTVQNLLGETIDSSEARRASIIRFAA